MPRIALIHATPVAVEPVVEAFRADWPDAAIFNLLDDSLAPDLAAALALKPDMIERFLVLGRYAKSTGADAILFTCSAFGAAIEEVARELSSIPVLKPNEAMFEEALAVDGNVGLVATFGPSLPSMEAEFAEMRAPSGVVAKLTSACAPDALAMLHAGDGPDHDRLIAEAASTLDDARIIALAQFSMARARRAVEAATGKPVLTSPASAVRKLKRALGAA